MLGFWIRSLFVCLLRSCRPIYFLLNQLVLSFPCQYLFLLVTISPKVLYFFLFNHIRLCFEIVIFVCRTNTSSKLNFTIIHWNECNTHQNGYKKRIAYSEYVYPSHQTRKLINGNVSIFLYVQMNRECILHDSNDQNGYIQCESQQTLYWDWINQQIETEMVAKCSEWVQTRMKWKNQHYKERRKNTH